MRRRGVGLEAADVTRCRVLELGCGTGRVLIPMAAHFDMAVTAWAPPAGGVLDNAGDSADMQRDARRKGNRIG